MRIALDFANPLAGGIMTYLKEMLRYLPEVDSENEYILLLADYKYKMIQDYLPIKNVKCIVFRYLQSNAYRFLWGQFVLPFFLKREKIDVLFNVNSQGPFVRLKCKKVILVSTLGPFMDDFIQFFSFFQRINLRIKAKAIITTINCADITIFESNFTKNLIENKYGFRGLCLVNYHGRPVIQSGNDNFESLNRVRKKYKITNDYFLYTTVVYRYKNFERLIEAYAIVQKKLQRKVDFIVAGELISKSYLQELESLCSFYGVKDSFRFIGKVEYFEELGSLRYGCIGFVFPTKFENMSYALVEALTYGLPIITTTGTSMPEACGKAALYFQPEDTYELADAMLRLVNDSNLRATLKSESLKQAKLFKNMKEEILFNLDVFQKVINGNK